MGTLLAIYSERRRRFFGCTGKSKLSTEGLRRVLASPLRYCLGGGEYFYFPNNEVLENDRLCWVRDREYHSLSALNEAIGTAGFDINNVDVRIGNVYAKRRREESGIFVEVEAFVSKQLYNSLQTNPEVLRSLTKDDFESLCAEVFARRGFEVDLFRKSGDGGIDFLAVRNDDLEPTIFAVQCKQPDERPGKRRNSLGRPVLQQIYGAAKAWDLGGAIAISGSTYTPQAAAFATNKPNEMFVHDGSDILEWIAQYRWNEDE